MMQNDFSITVGLINNNHLGNHTHTRTRANHSNADSNYGEVATIAHDLLSTFWGNPQKHTKFSRETIELSNYTNLVFKSILEGFKCR